MCRGGVAADTAAGAAEEDPPLESSSDPASPSSFDPTPATTTSTTTTSTTTTTTTTNTTSPSPPDLRICLNPDPTLGFCVYAARPYARGDCLFRERTALEATHDVDPRGVRNVYDRYCRLAPARRDALHGSFPWLAWANGVDAAEAAACRDLIGSRLLTKRCTLDVAVTAEQHMHMRPDMGGAASAGGAAASSAATAPAPAPAEPPAGGGWTQAARNFFRRRSSSPSPSLTTTTTTTSSSSSPFFPRDTARRLTLDWFGRYAFRLKPGSAFVASDQGAHHQAAVYLLTDLINHRCAGFQNCRVAAEVGAIAVLAVRDIAAGEEVTINYSKDVKDFQCKGECCVGRRKK